jgi:hypothetical protein
MQRHSTLATALALVSLGAACTTSEPLSRPTTEAGAASAAASRPAYAPAPPSSSTTAQPPLPPAPPLSAGAAASGGSAGASGQTAVSTGGTAATPVAATCTMPTPLPRPPVMTPVMIGATTTAAVPPRPLTGGGLLVLADGSVAVASDPDRDVVYVVDLKTRALRATVALWPGDEPGRLVADGLGLVHVALRRAGVVATIDPATGLVTRRDSVCTAPRGLAYDPSGDLVHVACAEGALVSLRATGGVARSVFVRRDLRDVVVTGSGQLLVSTFKTAEVLTLDGAGMVTTSARPPVRIGVSSSGGSRTTSPAVAWRMVPAGSGALMLHQRGVDDVVAPAPGGYAAGKGCDGIVETTATLVAPGDPSPSVSLPFGNVTLAVDVAIAPDGLTVAMAVPGNAGGPFASVMMSRLSSITQNGNGSGAGCLSGLPIQSAVVTGQPPGQVVSVAFAPDGTVVAQTRDTAALWTSDGKSLISLSSEPTADTGHRMFHMDAGGGIACASCHPEGGEDGRTWNFACLGPRRTQSLRGGLSGTEPFHWDGDMSNFPQLVKEVFVGRMSGPQPTDDQTAAMLHWLDSIPELPTPAPAAPAAVERGRALFNSAAVGCTTCHSGARLSNNMTVDVGTGMKLQVPSLRGVGWRAPFLHTGCAPTLADRFGSCGGGDQHGHTSQLGPGDVADLSAFLETL